MDRAQAFEVGLAVNLPRAELKLTFKGTRAALGLITLLIVSLFMHPDTRVVAQAVLCLYMDMDCSSGVREPSAPIFS